MADPEHLPNAPIEEAVIDVGAEFSEAVDQENLAKLQDLLAGRYPQKQVKSAWESHVQLKAGGKQAAETSGGPVGYLFRSSDGKQIMQARRDGFSFSRLRPYQNWDSFSEEARELWEKYSKLTKPKKVVRLGVRYINRMPLPLPFSDFSEYLLTAPGVAPGLPQSVANFFFRVVLPDEKAKALIAIIETVDEAHSDQNRVSIILDIDVFRTGVFPVTSDNLWPLIQHFREIKNNVFFSSITDKAKELFK